MDQQIRNRRTATGTAGFPPERWNDVLPDVLTDITTRTIPVRRTVPARAP